jgi:hypothetical protein
MGVEILLVLVVWLAIGVVVGGWISIDMSRRKAKDAKWIGLGIILNVIGLAIYLVLRDKKKDIKQPEHVTPPEYRFNELKQTEAVQAPSTETKEETVPEAPQTVPSPEPLSPTQDPQMQKPATLPTTPDESRPAYRTEQPKKFEKIEGIPRCPKCRAAVSSFDEFCPDCGAALK